MSRRNRKRRRESQPPAPPAALSRAYAESVAGMPLWMLQARLSDFSHGGFGFGLGGFGGGGATGTPSDRKGGRDLPLFWSEMDLRGYRVLARHITDSNPFGKGFSKLLRNYHVRKGYGWQATRRGAKKTPYATTGAPADPLVAKAQRLLDTWRDAVKWPLKSREAFLRWCREGEVYGRWFHGGTGRLPEMRFVSSDAVGSPTGDCDGEESFGHANAPGDVETVTDYHVFDADGIHGEWVGASAMVFAKKNTDSDVKRGLPDFFPVAQELDDCTELVRAMLATAIRQAKTAWIEKFRGVALAQVSATVPHMAPPTGLSGPVGAPFDLGGVPAWALAGRAGNPWEPAGIIRKVEGDREYQAGPVSSPAGYIQVEQAALRGCGVIWSFPEYFSGDASNNNMASAIVAGSPFTVEVESSQYEFGAVWERPCALKVLDFAVRAGLLTAQERAELDVEVTEPAVVSADPGKENDVISGQVRDGIVCLDTARQKLGYDPQHEAEGVKKDKAAAQPAPQPAGGGGAPPAGPTAPPAAPAPDDEPGGGGGGGPLGESREPALLSEHVGRTADGEEWVSEGLYALLGEAGRGDLVKKTITNKNGKPQVVWVRPGTAAAADDHRALARSDGTVADRALKDPAALTAADVGELVDHFAGLPKEQQRSLLLAFEQKIGGTKAELAKRLLEHVKAKGAGANAAATKTKTPAEKAKETKSLRQKALGLGFPADRVKYASPAALAEMVAKREGARRQLTDLAADPAPPTLERFRGLRDLTWAGYETREDATEAAARVVEAVLDRHAKDGGSVTAHGMTAAEPHRAVDVGGVTWSYSPASKRAVALSLANVAHGTGSFPPRVLAATKRVVFTAQANSADPYWKRQYNDPNHVSVATGGDGTVCVYSDNAIGASVYAHESGHNLATEVFGGTHPAHNSEYARAQAAEGPVTPYGAKSPAEDFAEAVAAYCYPHDLAGLSDPGAYSRPQLQKLFPKKFAALQKLFGDTS